MKFNTKKGFSLLELLTVMAMISIMIFTVLYFIGESRDSTELEAAADETVAALRETQNYSLTGKVAIGEECTSYTFSALGGSSNYSIIGGGSNCSFRIDYKVSANVLFQGGANVSFTTPHGDTSSTQIVLNKNGSLAYVCVNPVGLIQKSSIPCQF